MKSKIAEKIEKETPKELTEKVRTDTNLFLSGVNGCAFKSAFEVCFNMKYWCENVIAGADEDDDISKDEKMLKHCNTYLEWYRQHCR